MPSKDICNFCDKVRSTINGRRLIGLPTYGAIEVHIKEFSPEPLYIEVKNGNVSIQPYEYNNKDATITLDIQTLYDIYERRVSVNDALNNNRVIIDGDAEILHCLQRNL
ncbi:MAG: SCP2 sterol-binding domain-containing protein [Ruminococcus sp.]|nr:SCP2 sterol-binding domain-containing protein [Ruminococcus sp.]MCD7800471.1 SCP2 sterol-binding domain-containing protein [Ruminococcus sp.]